MSTDLPTIASGVSIYEFIGARLDLACRLADSATKLPDEAEVTASRRLNWGGGALDGAFGRHFGGGWSTARAEATGDVFVKACEQPTRRNLRELYQFVRDDDVLDYLDPMIERLMGPHCTGWVGGCLQRARIEAP